MRVSKIFSTAAIALVLGAAVSAAPPEGKGGGKGGGNGGDDEPPAEAFLPAIAYFEQSRKSKDLKLTNRAGDVACVVKQSGTSSAVLRGFVYDAANKMLAYSIGSRGIFLTTWDEDPCVVGDGTLIHSQASPEFMDFSPDGNYLVWRETVQDYSGFGTASEIFFYDLSSGTVSNISLDAHGGSRPEWGVNGEWAVSNVQFSPDFDPSNEDSPDELIFRGAPLDGSLGEYESLFSYNIDGQSAPRKFYDGGGDYIDIVMSVTNPTGGDEARIAITKGHVRQIAISNGAEGPTFDGYEPAYSCDNSEIIHRSGTGKADIRITAADGSSTETWSKANLRFFDWFCP